MKPSSISVIGAGARHPGIRLATLVAGFLFLVLAAAAPLARAASASADSNLTTVDTTSGLRSIAGRVLEAKTRQPLPGVTVTYSGVIRTTDAAGKFLFSGGEWPNGQEMSAGKAGYATSRKVVHADSGTSHCVLEDTFLSPQGEFSVLSLRPKYDALFLSGVALLNEYTAAVSWGGRTPGSVEFSVNGKPVQTV